MCPPPPAQLDYSLSSFHCTLSFLKTTLRSLLISFTWLFCLPTAANSQRLDLVGIALLSVLSSISCNVKVSVFSLPAAEQRFSTGGFAPAGCSSAALPCCAPSLLRWLHLPPECMSPGAEFPGGGCQHTQSEFNTREHSLRCPGVYCIGCFVLHSHIFHFLFNAVIIAISSLQVRPQESSSMRDAL